MQWIATSEKDTANGALEKQLGMPPSSQCLHLTLLKRFSMVPVRKDSWASSSCASPNGANPVVNND